MYETFQNMIRPNLLAPNPENEGVGNNVIYLYSSVVSQRFETNLGLRLRRLPIPLNPNRNLDRNPLEVADKPAARGAGLNAERRTANVEVTGSQGSGFRAKPLVNQCVSHPEP
jgi:hypothetical protein